MAHDLRLNVLRNDLDSDLHRSRSRVIDAGQERYELAHVNGLPEDNLIDRKGHDVSFGVAARTGVGDLIEKLEDMAPVHVAGKVRHVRSHQHRHG